MATDVAESPESKQGQRFFFCKILCVASLLGFSAWAGLMLFALASENAVANRNMLFLGVPPFIYTGCCFVSGITSISPRTTLACGIFGHLAMIRVVGVWIEAISVFGFGADCLIVFAPMAVLSSCWVGAYREKRIVESAKAKRTTPLPTA